MIQEFPIYEDTGAYFSEPLLEYALKVADNFWLLPGDPYRDEITGEIICEPTPSIAPEQFAIQFNNGAIRTEAVRKDLYESDDIQKTLEAFGLDCSKFWYLCLLIKWKVEIECSSARTRPSTTIEELRNLINEFEKLNPKAEPTHFFTTEVPAELSFTVEGNKAVKICNGNTLTIIGIAIKNYMQQLGENNPFFQGFLYKDTEQQFLSTRTKIFLFHKYLSWFIKPLSAKKGFPASKDKSLLISRMIFILGICDDEKLYIDLNEKGNKQNQLKGYLSRYKHPKYWSFDI